jgi:hypothetical protein
LKHQTFINDTRIRLRMPESKAAVDAVHLVRPDIPSVAALTILSNEWFPNMTDVEKTLFGKELRVAMEEWGYVHLKYDVRIYDVEGCQFEKGSTYTKEPQICKIAA